MRSPAAKEDLLRIVQSVFIGLLGNLPLMDSSNSELAAAIRAFQPVLTDANLTVKSFKEALTQGFMQQSKSETEAFREPVKKRFEILANPLLLRRIIETQLREQLPGKRGPKSRVPRESWPNIEKASERLRPVCEMMLELAEQKTTQPHSQILRAISILRPEWKDQCDFLLHHVPLVECAFKLAKLKRLKKARSRAALLADSLACTYEGHSATPSYSIEIVVQSKRLSEK